MRDPHLRSIWLAFSLLVALIVAAVAAGLSFAGDGDPKQAALFGGSAFAGTTILAIAILQFIAG